MPLDAAGIKCQRFFPIGHPLFPHLPVPVPHLICFGQPVADEKVRAGNFPAGFIVIPIDLKRPLVGINGRKGFALFRPCLPEEITCAQQISSLLSVRERKDQQDACHN